MDPVEAELVELALGGVGEQPRSSPGRSVGRGPDRCPSAVRAIASRSRGQQRHHVAPDGLAAEDPVEEDDRLARAFAQHQAGSRHISRIGGPPRPGMSKTSVSEKPLRS